MGKTLIIKDAGDGAVIARADLEHDVILHEGSYYLPPDSVDTTHLKVTDRVYTCPYKGKCYWVDLVHPDGTHVEDVAWTYFQVNPGYEHLKERFGFYKRNFRGTLVQIEETASEGAN